MAGTVTHTYFSKDIYKKLDNKSKKHIKGYENSFETFSQGHDIFFFDYGLNGKKTRNLGNYFHKHNTQDFFINMVKYIKNNNLENNPEIIAFLYGYICHYSLDLTVHPYVTYKGGYYNKKKKETIKYNGKHAEIESYIDAYLINKNEHIEPNKLNISKFCFKYKPLSNNLIEFINNLFEETYNYKKIGLEYKNSLKMMKILYSVLRNDKFGIKKIGYNFLDKILSKSAGKFSPISLNYKLNKSYYYLNLDHRKWNHPRIKEETYTYSFIDLYNNAMDLALNIISHVNKVLYEKMNIDSLNLVFTNLSFSSGKDCNNKLKNQFYEF